MGYGYHVAAAMTRMGSAVGHTLLLHVKGLTIPKEELFFNYQLKMALLRDCLKKPSIPAGIGGFLLVRLVTPKCVKKK